tara:strand:- start:398 stop:625 length:228 start_codon:yes stop_codon:yes gene_type:complete
MKNYLEPLLLIFLGLGLAATWHYIYVAPHDEARLQIIECMGEDMSKESYEACFESLRPEYPKAEHIKDPAQTKDF